MSMDRPLAGVALFGLSQLAPPPPAIPGGEKDNGDDSEYRELARTSHGHSPLVRSLDQLFYCSAPAARYEFSILSPFDCFTRSHISLYRASSNRCLSAKLKPLRFP